ncbi:hypothetical protein C8Q80DRAFT_1098823, partial [Daedaleopsis nitida]
GLVSNAHHKYARSRSPIPRSSTTTFYLVRSTAALSSTPLAMPPRSRPGPLQEFDLRLVPVLPTPRVPNHRKRPHSPSAGYFDSPAKRRLKAEEGSKLKSPLSTSSNSARFAPDHFNALLQGEDSPAKRLDFGSSESSDITICEAPRSSGGGSGTPRRSPKRTLTARIRRSPRLSARSPGFPPGHPGPAAHGQAGTDVHPVPARALTVAPMIIPREVTPPDRQSIHYPGFDVYQDPHIILPVTRSTSESVADDLSGSDKEQDKENVAPRRKSSKKPASPCTPSQTAWLKVLPPSNKVPRSPHPRHVFDYLSGHPSVVTPKERTLRAVPSPAATLVGATPGRTPLGKEERKQMRRAMEDEVDDVDGEDEVLL